MKEPKDIWNDCEPLCKEEVMLLTGCAESDIPTNFSSDGTGIYYGIDSRDIVYVFLQYEQEPRYVYRTYAFVDGRFTDIRLVPELAPEFYTIFKIDQ